MCGISDWFEGVPERLKSLLLQWLWLKCDTSSSRLFFFIHFGSEGDLMTTILGSDCQLGVEVSFMRRSLSQAVK